MSLENILRLQARISALESLVLELTANHPNANAIADALEARLAGQHATQIAGGTAQDFSAAYRDAQQLLVRDVRIRLRE